MHLFVEAVSTLSCSEGFQNGAHPEICSSDLGDSFSAVKVFLGSPLELCEFDAGTV